MGHRFGQVFLKDNNIVKKIIQNSDISKKDIVVEVGCGQGILSQALAMKSSKLYVIEIDEACIKQTKENLKDVANIEFICGDILKTEFDKIPAKNIVIVSNLPYYISAKFLKLLIKNRKKISSATIMLQQEFAEKLTAKPSSKQYTSLTLFCRYFLDIEYLFKVSKNCFQPVPKINSAVIKIKPKIQLPFKLQHEDHFFAIIRSCFWSRRKCLINCLTKSPYINLDPEFKSIPILTRLANLRGETLDLEAYYSLYLQLIPFIKSSQ